MKCKIMIHLVGKNPIVITDRNFSKGDMDAAMNAINEGDGKLIAFTTDTNYVAFHKSQFVAIHFSLEDGSTFGDKTFDDVANRTDESRAGLSNDSSLVDVSEFVDSLSEFEDEDTDSNDESGKIEEVSESEESDPVYDIDTVEEEDDPDTVNIGELTRS